MRKKSELVLSFILLPLDFLAILSAFVLAYIIRVKLDGRPVAYPLGSLVYLKFFVIVIPVWIAIFALTGLYSTSIYKRRFVELGKIFVGTAGGTMFLILVDFASHNPIFPSKSIPVYGFVLSLLFVFGERLCMARLRTYLYRLGIGVQRTVLVGSGEIAQRIMTEINSSNSAGHLIVALLDNTSINSNRFVGQVIYKTLQELQQNVDIRTIDEIIQADSGLDTNDIIDLVRFASVNGIRYRFIPNQFGLYATNAEFATIAGLPIIEIRKTPLDGWGRIVKRIFDIIGSLAGLIILSPVFAVLAIVSSYTNPGPVLYSHKRLSRSGDPIYVYKFRSMLTKWSDGTGYKYKTAEEAFRAMGRPDVIEEFRQNQKLKHDPRVSGFGDFMRRTSLDELPQLFNVLKGDLSLVGPRPIVADELVRYGDQAATFLALKPGITGMWQVSGRSDVSYEERIKLDIYYIENWSLYLDIQIIIKTVIMLLKGRGGY